MTRPLVCPSCGSLEAADARFCSRCGHALASTPGRERRARVSIVFCDLAGSTALGERLDPEVLRNVQERYFAACALALRAHGGQIEKYIGDAVMCVFGLPTAHEDDALRAARGAVDLVAAVEQLNVDLRANLGVELSVRVGVNTGDVVAGDHSRGHALVTGDAVNTAARLEQAAPAGGILMGELTHRLVGRHLDSEPVKHIQAKGKAVPLAAWRLRGLGVPSARRATASGELVGREGDLAALEAAFAEVESTQRAHLVVVCGEAGIGKTRVVAEFAARAPGRMLTGTCPSYGRGNTYRPLLEVIDAVAPSGTHAELAALLASGDEREVMTTRLVRLIGREPGPVTGPEAFAAVERFFSALAQEAPLTLVLEDLHWAEPTFVDLVQHLADSLTAPVLIVGTARDEFVAEHPDFAHRTIRLTHLTDAAAAELLAQRGKLSGPTIAHLVARGGGNPLFLEQLAAWRSEGSDSVPADVAGLIAARLDLLDDEARLVLEAASIVGRDFLPGAVERLVTGDGAFGDVDTTRALATLEARGFVLPGASSALPSPTGLSGVFAGGRLHVRHALVFDAVRSAMPKARRADLHERFAAELAERAHPETAVVGYHLEQAALLRMQLQPRAATPPAALAAAAHLEQAGLQALEHGDASAAGALLSRARDLLPPSAPQRADIDDALERSRVSLPATTEDELQAGSEIGGYVIEAIAGRGGMATVYRARDPALERSVALKVISPALAGHFLFRERFVRESRTAAGIDHPGVVPVYRAGEDGGRLFIAMRYLRGGDFAERLRRDGRLPPVEAARCVHAVALALDAAHARGLVHRDVKPANMMLDDSASEQVYLTDFGLSSDQLATSDLTRTGQWVGTVAYSAPEQVRGATVDARADIYALGGVLHHLLTGKVPYPSASELDALAAHLTEAPPCPSRAAADVPRELDAVVARAMAKDPAQRYASAGDLGRAALAAARGGRAPQEHGSVATGAAAPGAVDSSPRIRTVERARTHRRAFAISATALALSATAGVVTAVVTRGGSHSSPRNPAGALVGAPIRLSSSPSRLAANSAFVWTMAARGPGVTRIDVQTRTQRTVFQPFDLGGGDFPDIAADESTVWVAHKGSTLGGVDRFADANGHPAVHVPLAAASAVAVAPGITWAASDPKGNNPGTLLRIAALSGKVTGRVPRVGLGASDIAVDTDGVWVACSRDDTVVRIDPKTLRVVARIRVGDQPSRLAIAGSSVWVLNTGDRTITRIDERSNLVRGAPLSLGKELQDIASDGGFLWVAASDRTLTRLDARTGAAIGTPIAVGTPPLALSARGRTVWIGSEGSSTVQRVDLP